MKIRRSRTQSIVAGALLGTVFSLPALADENDTLNLRLTETLTRDNNLFRLPSGVDPATVGAGKSSRSDTIRTDTIALTLDKQISLQRFHLGASFSNYTYSNYGFLDHNVKNLDGRWNWSLTPHVTGLVSAERTQALNSFADYQNYVRSIRTTDTLRATGEFGKVGALRFVAGVGQSKVSNSLYVLQEGDYRTRNVQGGVRYVTASENTVGYLFRENWIDWFGRDLNPVALYDTGARQTDHEVNATWHALSQVTADGAIARIQRRHDNFGTRDYSGTNARVNVNWLPQTKLQVGLGAKREYAAWWDQTASYTVTDSLSVAPVWEISPKVWLRGRIEALSRDFEGAVAPTPLGSRHDNLSSAQVGLDWTPIRSITLGTSLQKTRRSSNYPGLNFDDTTASVSAQLNF